MSQEHPITPPPELVQQWASVGNIYIAPLHLAQELATQAARWGADQELEACINEIYKGVGLRHIDYSSNRESLCSDLRAARRPKPPSLKAQSLASLDKILSQVYSPDAVKGLEPHSDIIRRALEALPDDPA